MNRFIFVVASALVFGCGSPPCKADADCLGDHVCRAAVCVSQAASSSGPSCVPGTVCRAAVGPCDVAELCSPRGSCPADQFTSAAVICRAMASACDVEERCSGVSAQCPADTTLCGAGGGAAGGGTAGGAATGGGTARCLAGTVCRPASGPCDVPELCSLQGTCPTDTFSAASVTCRPQASACDVAEQCTGASAQCPPDATTCNAADAGSTGGGSAGSCSPGTECRPATGPCDDAEFCSSQGRCPPDQFRPASVVCRAQASACDVEERCTGISPACPPDVTMCGGAGGGGAGGGVASGGGGATCTPGTECRPARGPCDVAEFCTSQGACPSDVLLPAGIICRASAGVCDAAEMCGGGSAACPADSVLAAGTVCRPAAGACDLTETCTGASASCPADLFQAQGTICRAAVDACDAPESCTGASASCPSNQFAPAGTLCHGTPYSGPARSTASCGGENVCQLPARPLCDESLDTCNSAGQCAICNCGCP